MTTALNDVLRNHSPASEAPLALQNADTAACEAQPTTIVILEMREIPSTQAISSHITQEEQHCDSDYGEFDDHDFDSNFAPPMFETYNRRQAWTDMPRALKTQGKQPLQEDFDNEPA